MGLGKNKIMALAILLGGEYTGEQKFLILAIFILYLRNNHVVKLILIDGVKGVAIINGLAIFLWSVLRTHPNVSARQ